MDKRLIVAELKNIFELVTACFDKKALFKLLCKKIKEKIKRWKVFLENEVSKKYKGIIDLPKDFDPEKMAEKALRRRGVTEPMKLDDAVDYVMLYLLIPQTIDKNRKTILQNFENAVSKKPGEKHNFEGYFTNGLNNAIKQWFIENKETDKLESDYDSLKQKVEVLKKEISEVKDDKRKEYLKKELEKKEKELKTLEKELTDLEDPTTRDIHKHSPKEETKYPGDLNPDMIADIQDARVFLEDVKYEDLRDDFAEYVKKNADELTKKIIIYLLNEENPSVTVEEISKALSIPEDKIYKNKKDRKSITTNYALKLKKETGDDTLYDIMKNPHWDLVPHEKLKEGSIENTVISEIEDVFKTLTSSLKEEKKVIKHTSVIEYIKKLCEKI